MCVGSDEWDRAPTEGGVCGHVNPMKGTEGDEFMLWKVWMEFDLIYGRLKPGVRRKETRSFQE